ncbi:MAG: ACT domain-containing protein [Nitrospirae bacterium]|nr:ACT domain-containing protein [Nitrospirota bacterium]MBI5406535.1 ACT domain-containing protein [Nitrospirota bacterium]
MADTIRKVAYYKVEVPNRPGEGVRLLGALREAGVNLLAFTGFPNGRKAQIDFIPEDEAAFKKAAKGAGLKVGAKKSCFLVQGEDRVGAVADILSILAAAKINVTAVDAIVAGGGRYGVILWVKSEAVAKTKRLLRAV